MVYRLKVVRYQNNERRILLQNENGPCPLLAAANALLLKGVCSLPPASIRNGVASLEDVTNMLAEQAMKGTNHDHAVYVDELVRHIPKFQYGMDVNPSFTQGITGYEFTAQLTAFDMLRCKLVHGWLCDIHDEETFKAFGTKTYNELVERVIHAKEASNEIQTLQTRILEMKQAAAPVDLLDDAATDPTQQQELHQLETKLSELQKTAHDALLVEHFFETTSHQLTHYGLMQLHEHLEEDELCVFFRNNHFGTLTKHEGLLYLLVTDLGYANSPAIVWERLDVVDGDTEFVNSEFKTVGAQGRLLESGPTLTPEQMMAASNQNDADYHLALHLSMQPGQGTLDEQEGKIMAAATEASLREFHGLNSSLTEKSQGERVEVGVPVNSTSPPVGTIVQTPEQPKADDAAIGAESHESADRILAMQLQEDQDKSHEEASLHLARQLQEEENRRALATNRPPQQQQQQLRRPITSQSSGSGSSCVIS